MSVAHLTLIGKPGCHLCDDARDVVNEVIASFDAGQILLEELSILEDDSLNQKFAEEIPVVLIDGQVHNIWRIDPARLRAALVSVTNPRCD